jgi:hypothetical protein
MFKIGDYIKLLDWKKIGIVINEDNVYYLIVDPNGETYSVPKNERVFVKKSNLEEYKEFVKQITNVTNI